jgi:hypothetical protein
MIACRQEDAKAVIANLPQINYPEECYETGDCDRTIEHEVFTTLAKLSRHHLKRGMSEGEVEKVFRRPSYGGIDSWKDVRFGNPVTTWEYAASLSGTTAFYIIFVDGRLDDLVKCRAVICYGNMEGPVRLTGMIQSRSIGFVAGSQFNSALRCDHQDVGGI